MLPKALLFVVCASQNLFPALPQEALGASPVVDGRTAVSVALLSDKDTLAPSGTAQLGLHFALSPNWHIYGQNPGSAGFPTAVTWQIQGGEVSPPKFAAPQMFQESDDVFTYGYSGNTLLTATVTAAADTLGPVVVEAQVKYLACNIICSPGEVRLRRTLAITAEGARPGSDEELAAFEAAKQAATTPPPSEADRRGAPVAPLHLVQAVLLALLGGLVLNLMPCVLPVLALKAVALLQPGHSAQVRRRHGLLYAVGVMGSTLALGLGVMAVRAAGHSVGWGFQFQQPLFIAATAVGILLFACSCFGLFEVTHGVQGIAQAHSAATGARRSLLEGVLAVLVATPCSAPFLGTAVAFALSQPDGVVALVFVAIGAGLALPFVILSAIPSLGRLLPRPGPWMSHLKILLGFSLLFTCVWLVWLFAKMRGVDDGAVLLVLMVAGAAGSWALGLLAYNAPQRLAPGLVALLVALICAGRLALPETSAQAQFAQKIAPFSQALVDGELRAGRNVLVDFTADWCITCKYNERHVLQDAVVQQALVAHHVTLLKADFTHHDDEILATLKRHGRAGVPMYLLYTPTTQDKPLLLPELLTISTLQAALAGL